MTQKSTMAEAKETIADAAKTGVEELKTVATEAIGAAAAAAAGVVMNRVAEALGAGERKLDEGAAVAAKQVAAQPFMSKGSDPVPAESATALVKPRPKRVRVRKKKSS